MSEWQPIETAPKGGTTIIAWCVCPLTGDGWIAADVEYWEPREHWLGVSDGIVSPTHWMPLPPPPSDK